MKKLLISLLLLALNYSPSIAASIPHGNGVVKHAIEHTNPYADSNITNHDGWKSSDRFELSYIDGYQEFYNPEETMVFYVEGKSDKMNVDKANGFYAGATIHEISQDAFKPATKAEVEYDTTKGAWHIKLIAPKDNTIKYEISVALYCSKIESPCAATYGSGTQVNKQLSLQVR